MRVTYVFHSLSPMADFTKTSPHLGHVISELASHCDRDRRKVSGSCFTCLGRSPRSAHSDTQRVVLMSKGGLGSTFSKNVEVNKGSTVDYC